MAQEMLAGLQNVRDEYLSYEDQRVRGGSSRGRKWWGRFESEGEDVVNPINLGVLSPTSDKNVDDSPKHMRKKKG